MATKTLFHMDVGSAEYQSCRGQAHVRAAIEEAFAAYAPIADVDYVDAFRTRTTQRLWELFTFHVLRRDGKDPASPRRHTVDDRVVEGGPDFLLQGSPRVWVECVASGPGEGENRVAPMPDGFGTYAVVDPKADLRLVTSVDEKRKKFDGYRSRGIVQDGDVNVVALHARDVHPFVDASAELGVPVYVRMLYGLGAYYERVVPVGDGSVIFPGAEWERRIVVEKRRDEHGVIEVGTALFFEERYAQVSALIGGMPGARAFLDDDELRGRGLVIVHNPRAKAPLPRGFFGFGAEYWVEGWDGTRGTLAVREATRDAPR
ncbi:MAG: hypothetical protein IT383_20955 [Deltaproteobacteria bacterium]|nr:hypothetical protein [Deltaproteobacteria bacterium]